MKNKSFFERLRFWLDDAAEADSLQEVADFSQSSRKSEEFMNNILRSLDAILQDEMFVPPKGQAQVPSKFVVFLNPTDDSLWQNKKREALEKNLSELILERAVELAGSNSLSATNIKVTIKLDKNLVSPMFEIVAFWDDENTKGLRISYPDTKAVAKNIPETPLFRVMISKDGQFQQELPIYKKFALIGRERKASEVDILLEAPNISRLQAGLFITKNDSFMITNYGENSISIEGTMLATNETALFLETEQIRISSFSLKILSPNFPEKSLQPPTQSNNPFLTVRN